MRELYADIDQAGVVIVSGPHDRTDLEAIAGAARGRVLAVTDWATLPEVATAEPVRLILASTRDVEDKVLADAMPAVERLAAESDAAVIVVLSTGQIDLVASSLFGPAVDLLCEPEPGALAATAALALAQRSGFLADPVREREAERLRRLNDEVARIADVLARLSNASDRRPGTLADRRSGYMGAPPAEEAAVSAADIRKAIRARRLRDLQFPGMLEDPAWDILLDLYAAELEGAQVSVSSLCIAAAVPATTALRWIARMTDAGLLERQPDPFDRRRAFMALTDEGRDRMARYFASLSQNGLRIA